MADKKKMTVAEMLAAARKADGKSSDAPKAEQPAEQPDEQPAAPAAASEKPAAAAPKLKPGEKPSVADILAMARSGDAKGAAKPAAAEEKPKAAPAAAEKKPAAKPAAKAKPAASAPAERMTTASILAAARTGEKRGPMTKAEAAEKQPALAKTQPKKPAAPKPPTPTMPEKPGYAVPKSKPAPQPDQARRTGLKAALAFFVSIPALLFANPLATGMTALTTAVGLWCLALARFMFPNILTEPPSQFKIGFPDDFPPGQVETKFKAQYAVWVVNGEYKGQPEIFALSTVCTHLGCTPNWLESEQKFKCPCHGSGFYSNGINFEGPAPRPLERYAIRIADDGQLEIDKSRKFQEEMGQWADPASFVPV